MPNSYLCSVALALATVCPIAIAQQDSTTIREQFKSPAKMYRPLVRWWWPGNDVTEVELRREVGVLDKAGFGGAEIQPFSIGLAAHKLPATEMKRVNDYPSPAFFRNVGTAVDEARKHGMFVDYTFGSGWPFGGGDAITPELASIELRSSHRAVQGPAKFHARLQMPSVTDRDPLTGPKILQGLPDGWPKRMEDRTKLVAVVAVRGEDALWYPNQVAGRDQAVVKSGELEKGTSVDLTSHMQSDGTLDWDVPPGTWQIFVFRSVPTVHKVVGGVGDGPQLEMDHLNAAAFAAHAKEVGDKSIPYIGEYFGNGLRAIFCDSLEVTANLYWSDDFLAEFRRRRGYDLLPYLPLIKVQGYGGPFGEYDNLPAYEMHDIGDQVRRDYRQTVSDLIIERFYDPFNSWAHAHKLLSRTQSHGAPGDVLRIYGDADIPETEDLYDEGRYDFLKMAASGAHVYGRSIVGSESFVWRNGAYQTTPEKMKLAADELLTAGINAILYHGFPYIIPGLSAPGWYPFAGTPGKSSYSSQFNELNPFWNYFAQLNSYITRVQYISQAGKDVAAVALYLPELAHGAKEPPPPTPELNQHLMDAGYNYDHINTESLLHSNVQSQMLVTAGGAHYRVLLLPSLDVVDSALAEQLGRFASAGLPIIFAGNNPTREGGLLDNAARTQRVQVAMRRAEKIHNVYSASSVDGAMTVLSKTVSSDIRFHGRAFPFFQKRIGGTKAFFLRNTSDATQHLDAEFEADGVPELWNPWTGETGIPVTNQRTGKLVRVSVDMQPLGSALIVFNQEAAAPVTRTAGAIEKTPTYQTREVGTDGWELTATGLVPSGKTATIIRKMPTLVDWSLDSELKGFSGHGRYATAFHLQPSDIGKPLMLDLGNVGNVADVVINEKSVATLLLHPYVVDITKFVSQGDNKLELTVTNALFNSMVLRTPRTFGAGHTDNPSGLMSGGLLGPVQIRVIQ